MKKLTDEVINKIGQANMGDNIYRVNLHAFAREIEALVDRGASADYMKSLNEYSKREYLDKMRHKEELLAYEILVDNLRRDADQHAQELLAYEIMVNNLRDQVSKQKVVMTDMEKAFKLTLANLKLIPNNSGILPTIINLSIINSTVTV